jgi:hypothetical protein
MRGLFAVIIASMATPALAQTIKAKDFDLACATAASAEMATAKPNSEEWQYMFTVVAFYLGRLSGRDDRTYWYTDVKGRIAEMHERAKSDEMMQRCIEFFSQKVSKD